MRSYRNPFRYRTSEQESLQGLKRFLKTFGPGALDMLPEHVWDRPLIIQSAPGAGKTSLLRIFSADALLEISNRPEELSHLHERMTSLGAIQNRKVRLLGIRLALKRDFQAINDLRLPMERGLKVFFRLLDAQLVREFAMALRQLVPEEHHHTLRVVPSERGADALERIGGSSLDDLIAWSRSAHREMLDKLDSVLPPSLDGLGGHLMPYAVRALSGARFFAGEEDLELRPLLMFDDSQDLTHEQRTALLSALADRDLDLHRWLAERYEALSPGAVVAGEQPHRSYTLVRIEDEARLLGAEPRRGKRTKGFERLLLDIADLRAAGALRSYADEDRRLRELLDLSIEADDPRVTSAIDALDRRLSDAAGESPRYEEWLKIAGRRRGYEGAVFRRVIEILIYRDRQRTQDTLFTVPLTEAELKDRTASGLGETAELFLRRELKLPFYCGLERLTRLGSENIEQYVGLAGEFFEEILARVTLGENPMIEPMRQDAIATEASEGMWRDIPRRFAEGSNIQRLLLNIASICRADTYRPTAPYPPGATATAISMRDRERLLDPAWRKRVPGAQQLFAALAGAIGHNLLAPELNYSVKNDRWMVLYLNRLLCVRFGLALGLGGIRERPLEDLCSWMVNDVPKEGDVVEPGVQEQLAV